MVEGRWTGGVTSDAGVLMALGAGFGVGAIGWEVGVAAGTCAARRSRVFDCAGCGKRLWTVLAGFGMAGVWRIIGDTDASFSAGTGVSIAISGEGSADITRLLTLLDVPPPGGVKSLTDRAPATGTSEPPTIAPQLVQYCLLPIVTVLFELQLEQAMSLSGYLLCLWYNNSNSFGNTFYDL